MNGVAKVNTKTENSHKELQSTTYKRQPIIEMTNGSKQRTKTLILARHGMLECGTNFHGTMSDICKHCNKKDDENHRLNECQYLSETNWANSNDKIEFSDVYSNDNIKLTSVIERLENIWEFRYANGRMRK